MPSSSLLNNLNVNKLNINSNSLKSTSDKYEEFLNTVKKLKQGRHRRVNINNKLTNVEVDQDIFIVKNNQMDSNILTYICLE